MVIAFIYLIVALILCGLILSLIVTALLIIALALIWYDEEIGEYTAGFTASAGPITRRGHQKCSYRYLDGCYCFAHNTHFDEIKSEKVR